MTAALHVFKDGPEAGTLVIVNMQRFANVGGYRSALVAGIGQKGMEDKIMQIENADLW